MKLTMRAVGHLHGEEMKPTDTINRWKVEPLEKETFIVGFNVDRPIHNAYWQITGRKGNYKTAEEALAVLQKEQDAA